MTHYVTNAGLRAKLGQAFRRVEAGDEVVVVDRKQRRARVRIVAAVELDLDIDELEKSGRIDREETLYL